MVEDDTLPRDPVEDGSLRQRIAEESEPVYAGDLARLPRIATLNNIKLKPKDVKSGNVLTLDATVMTYRYLDSEELAAQRKQQKGKGGAK